MIYFTKTLEKDHMSRVTPMWIFFGSSGSSFSPKDNLRNPKEITNLFPVLNGDAKSSHTCVPSES